MFDLHLLIDGLQEGELTEAAEQEQLNNGQVVVAKKSTGGAIGTTKKGIGPAYSAKHARSGVRIHQIFNKDEFDKRLRVLARGAQKRYGSAIEGYDVEEEIARFDVCLAIYLYFDWRLQSVLLIGTDVPRAATRLRSRRSTPYGQRTEEQHEHTSRRSVSHIIPTFITRKTETAWHSNALMLDIDYGTYPFVTSSATGTGGAISGLGLSPFKIKHIIGVVKAYTTRVGGQVGSFSFPVIAPCSGEPSDVAIHADPLRVNPEGLSQAKP